MPDTNSPLNIIIGTSFMAASLPISFCSMCPANSSFLCLVATSFMATYLHFGTMSIANSSLLGIIGASFVIASLNFGTMSCTDSSSYNSVGTSFMHASLNFGAMSYTHSTFLCLVGASFMSASTFLCCCSMSYTYSFFITGYICASSMMTSFYFCTMSRAYSSVLSLIGAILHICIASSLPRDGCKHLLSVHSWYILRKCIVSSHVFLLLLTQQV